MAPLGDEHFHHQQLESHSHLEPPRLTSILYWLLKVCCPHHDEMQWVLLLLLLLCGGEEGRQREGRREGGMLEVVTRAF